MCITNEQAFRWRAPFIFLRGSRATLPTWRSPRSSSANSSNYGSETFVSFRPCWQWYAYGSLAQLTFFFQPILIVYAHFRCGRFVKGTKLGNWLDEQKAITKEIEQTVNNIFGFNFDTDQVNGFASFRL